MRSVLLVGLTLALVCLVAWPPGLTPAPGGGRAPGPGPALAAPRATSESACVVSADKSVDPSMVTLGESVTLTFRVVAECPALPRSMVVFLVHATGTVLSFDAGVDAARTAARDLGDAAMVGLVAFDDERRLVCPVTDDPDDTAGCVAVDRGMGMASAIDEAVALFSLARGESPRWSESIVLVSDKANPGGCESALAAAVAVRGTGMTLMTACVGPECDTACMLQLASSQRYFHEAEDAAAVPIVLAVIDTGLRELLAAQRAAPLRVKVTEKLRPNMDYVRGSAVPEPSESSPTRDEFTWRLEGLPGDPISATLAVTPLDVGVFPTSLEATGELVDQLGQTMAFEFPPSEVVVTTPISPISPAYLPYARIGR